VGELFTHSWPPSCCVYVLMCTCASGVLGRIATGVRILRGVIKAARIAKKLGGNRGKKFVGHDQSVTALKIIPPVAKGAVPLWRHVSNLVRAVRALKWWMTHTCVCEPRIRLCAPRVRQQADAAYDAWAWVGGLMGGIGGLGHVFVWGLPFVQCGGGDKESKALDRWRASYENK